MSYEEEDTCPLRAYASETEDTKKTIQQTVRDTLFVWSCAFVCAWMCVRVHVPTYTFANIRLQTKLHTFTAVPK